LVTKLGKLLGKTDSKLTKSWLNRLILDESGQGLTEYILILSASILAATQLARKMIDVLDKGILRLGSELEKDLKTGRAPLSVWEN
jgi:hypothetical protein